MSDGRDGESKDAALDVAVLLTPAGSGAIAVIRLSGPSNASFIAKHFTGKPREGRCAYGDLRDGDEVIDDIVVVQTPNGALDLNAHGGPWVTQAVLNLAERAGYTIQPWQAAADISLDAADEIERQMLLDLPAAKSKAVLRLLTAQPAAWRAMLAANDRDGMQAAIDDTALETALAVPTVAIVGPPNVGKSTLANALFGQARSITADVPGTTRDWVGELADIDGLIVKLIDTPGVRETADAIEAEAIAKAGTVVQAADMVVVAMDGSVPLETAGREQLFEWVPRFGTPSRVFTVDSTAWSTKPWHPERTLLVTTKCDLPQQAEFPDDAIAVSAAHGIGLDELRSAIRTALGCGDMTSPHARCWTAAQRDQLRDRLAGLLSLPGGGSTIARSEPSRP